MVGDFLAGLDVTERSKEYAAVIDVSFRIRIAGVIGVAREVVACLAVDRDAGIDFIKVTVAAPLELDGFLGADASTSVLGDFFPFSDRPCCEQAETGERAADPERSSGHRWTCAGRRKGLPNDR